MPRYKITKIRGPDQIVIDEAKNHKEAIKRSGIKLKPGMEVRVEGPVTMIINYKVDENGKLKEEGRYTAG